MKKLFFLAVLLALLIYSPSWAKTPFKVLFVNDNSVFQSNTDTVLYALTQAGATYDIFDARDSLRSPSILELTAYDLVIWYCSTDGVGNYLWDGTDSDNTSLMAYLEGGGKLWLMGNDFMYDRYSTPHTFMEGDFAYDYLGIWEYSAQSYGDDGNLGVEELDLAIDGFSSVSTIRWVFPTAWWIDACSPTLTAASLYEMGPDSYSLAGFSSAIWYPHPNHPALTFFFDPALIDTYANRLQLFRDMLVHFQLYAGVKPVDQAQKLLHVYPNPGNQFVNIDIPVSMQKSICEVRLTDASGRIILSNQSAAGEKSIRIETGILEAGVYILNLKSEQGNENLACRLFISK